MNRTTLLQDRRMLKFEELLKRWHHGELSGAEAGEFLGCSERQFRRYRRRYEEDGLEGLVDGRLGKASARRIAVDEVMWMSIQSGQLAAGPPPTARGRAAVTHTSARAT